MAVTLMSAPPPIPVTLLTGFLGSGKTTLLNHLIRDPGPILHTLLMEPALAQAYQMDGVVTTACVATGPHSLDAQFEAVNQVALADRIVLTKTDLVTTTERQAFEDRLARINPGALPIRRHMAGSTPVSCSASTDCARARISARRWVG